MSAPDSLTYKAAGVDIDAGSALVERIRDAVSRTRRPEAIGGLGGFGGLFRVPAGYSNPVLVAGADGVGTKLKLAMEHDAHDDVGIDLVAMCVNDVVVQGAEPLFFLDYFVTPKLDVDVAARVISGIARGCEMAGATLLGGETAEHPGMHAAGEYDLAGFCVGIVEQDRIIDGRSIRVGDAVIGLGSSGAHSNGYSLIRHVLGRQADDVNLPLEGKPLIEHLLAPTRIYVRTVLQLRRTTDIKGVANITGGGLTENIPRVLPDGLGVELDESSWPQLPVFQWLAQSGVAREEQHRTFNCGIGMVVIISPDQVDDALAELSRMKQPAWRIGEVTADPDGRVRIL
jgi:phosphoribosylformylglycinamidine cyclo-ligase